jgi:hypothetical protein
MTLTLAKHPIVEQYESLIECLQEGDTESVEQWLHAAIKHIERETPSRELGNSVDYERIAF